MGHPFLWRIRLAKELGRDNCHPRSMVNAHSRNRATGLMEITGGAKRVSRYWPEESKKETAILRAEEWIFFYRSTAHQARKPIE